jgi:tetratricopeptide (TPR) repeat protein
VDKFRFRNWLRGFWHQPDYDSIEQVHREIFKMQMNPDSNGKQDQMEATRYFNSANSRYNHGDISGAVADYNRAVELNPGYAKAYNNRAIVRASALKDMQGALRDFDRAIEIDPAYADAYLGRGTAWLYLHDLNAACRDWNSARSLGNVQAARLIGLHCNGK